MIARLKGTLLEKDRDAIVLEAGGVGYEVHMTSTAAGRLPPAGEPAEAFIVESTAMYGGGTTLYGFPSREEKEIFLCLREHVPATGAKKALEYLDKASRSLPDFRRAIMEGDARVLSEGFAFSRKTAERLIAALKDKLGEAPAGSRAKTAEPGFGAGPMAQAMEALASLGYRPAEARQALQAVGAEVQGGNKTVEDILRLALKRL